MNNQHLPPLEWGIAHRNVAAPSWVFAGSIQENCEFLAGKVDEVALLFFDVESSLAYTKVELPHSLAFLPLTYHVHLPQNLPWEDGAKAATIAVQLMDNVSHLQAKKAVLHPAIMNAEQFLPHFVNVWCKAGRNPSDILVENIKGCDLTQLAPVIDALGVKVCLDIGHFLAYNQSNLASTLLLTKNITMLHLNAPGKGNKLSSHLPLTELAQEDVIAVRAICDMVPANATIVLELFSCDAIIQSLPLAREWLLCKNKFVEER